MTEEEATLRERVAAPANDQEVIDALVEYLLEEHDDPITELDLLELLRVVH